MSMNSAVAASSEWRGVTAVTSNNQAQIPSQCNSYDSYLLLPTKFFTIGKLAPGDWIWCRAYGSEKAIPVEAFVAQDANDDEPIVASATLLSHFVPSTPPIDTSCPASIRLEVNTSAIATSAIALAQYVQLKPHLSHIPSALLSYELSSLLPLLLSNRVIGIGSVLQSSLLLSLRGVGSLQVLHARSFGNGDDTATKPKAFLITSQTVISIQPHVDPSAETSLSPCLPSRQFASSASEWIDRTSHHMTGFHSTISTWIHTMWNNVHSYRMAIQQPQAMNFTSYSPHTFLVHGLSGTGKTHVCRTLAACSGLPYYFLQASSLLQRVEGATESALVQLFQNARTLNEPCVLILDEIDAILPRNAADSDAQGGADEDDATNGAAVMQERGVGWKMGNSRIEWRVAAVLKDLLHELNSIDIPLPGLTTSISPVVPPVFVFFTTSSLTSLEVSGLRMSPFVDQEIELKALTLDERLEALQMSIEQLNFEAGVDHKMFAAELASQLHGYVSADIDGFVRELVLRALKRCRIDVGTLTASPLKASQVTIRREDVDAVLEWFRPSNLQQLEFRLPVQSNTNQTSQIIPAHLSENSPLPLQAVAHHFESLAGITSVLQRLHYSFLLPIKQPNLYKNFWQSALGMKASKGVLIYGQSGVGKTSLAMCLARACGLNAMVVPSTSLVSKIVGSAEKSLANLFAKARASAPSLLIFDQMEMIAPVRKGLVSSSSNASDAEGDDDEDSHDVDAYERMLSVLLIEMDGVLQSNGASDQVYVVATSTRPDLIDPALLRPSRLDSHVHIPSPSQADRLEILKHLFKNTPVYVQTDDENRIIMPQQFSLAIAVLDAEIQEKVVLREWDYMISSNASAPTKASEQALVNDLLVFLSHVTHAYSGADLVAFQRESALHALRRDLSSSVVLSWTDMLQSSLRSMRGSLEGQIDYHPFGVQQAGAAFAWQQSEQYSGARMTHSVGGEGQQMFSHKTAAEIAVKSVVTASVVTNAHTTPIKPVDSSAFAFDSASFSLPAQAPISPSAFVFEPPTSSTVSFDGSVPANAFSFVDSGIASTTASGFAVGSSETEAATQRTPKKRSERFQNIKDRF